MSLPVFIKHDIIPDPRKYRNPEDGPPGAPEEGNVTIESLETTYLWEFDRILPQLNRWREDGTLADDCKFYIIEGSSVGGWKFTFQEWSELPFSDLSLLNRFGQKMAGLASPEEVSKIILDQFKTAISQELKR